MKNDVYTKALLNRLKGVSGTGGLFGSIKDLRDEMFNVLEPGDLAIMARDGAIERSQSAPVAYDLWYLKHFVNLLEQTSDPETTISETYLADQLEFLASKLNGLRPMQIIEDLDDLVRNENDYWVATGVDPRWQVNNKSFLNLLAYEMCLFNLQEQFPSDGVTKYDWIPYYEGTLLKHRLQRVNDPALFIRKDYAGYIAFPCGQLGVMEVLAVLKQTGTEADGFEMESDEWPVAESTCDFMFPPIDDNTGKNKCFGDQFIESGYKIPEGKDKNVEWLETWPIPFEYYKDCAPQQWIRYWIHKDEQWPVPGEFIGIIAKSLALPPHIWWFQNTCPFVYSGNWMETDNLTSGVVVEKTLEADRDDGGIGNKYKVKVQGWDVYIYSSDFKDYSVGDRVGVLKTVSPYEASDRQFQVYDKARGQFYPDTDRTAHSYGEAFVYPGDWQRLLTDTPMGHGYSFDDMPVLEEKHKDTTSYDYLILPIEFYNNTD